MTLDDLGDRLFCDVPELARITGRDERTVRESIKAGQIPGTQIGKQYLVPTAWLRGQVSPAQVTSGGTSAPDMEQLADLLMDRLVVRFARMFAAVGDVEAAV
jgi:helix-turn-helix protein